jgi:hypothetical protein
LEKQSDQLIAAEDSASPIIGAIPDGDACGQCAPTSNFLAWFVRGYVQSNGRWLLNKVEKGPEKSIGIGFVHFPGANCRAPIYHALNNVCLRTI